MTILIFIYVAAVVMLAFGASIFFHELGHYWVARRIGMKVEEFAVGFGPKLYGFKRKGIEYSLRWIPAGGFVKLPQMITSEALEGHANEPVLPAAPWQRILVAFAGPFMNVVFAFAIATVVYFAGLPVAVNPSIIGYVEPNSPEAKMGIHEGDRIVSVDGKPVTSWQEITMDTILARTTVLLVTIEHNGHDHTYSLQTSTDNALALKMLNLDPRDHPDIQSVLSGSPAEKAGLKPKDVIVSFGSVPVVSREQLIDLVRQRGGQPSQIQVERNGKRLTFTITPAIDPTTKIARIGVELGAGETEVYVVEKPGPSPWAQVRDVVNKTFETIGALIHSHETGVGVQDLSGPVGILSILAVETKTDFRLTLSFLVLLNINLAIINLLPIPVLDGGHILIAIIEKIRRRPLSLKFIEVVTTGFAALLIGFMLYVTFYGDVRRFSIYREMFEDHAQIEQASQPPNAPAPPASAAPQK
ncbi:MAG TPA: RIP metalloprotease RseP [Verrucomicrobiae bacterium]|nr:RIP metalloprotease RseP [Verrucomicrobiae bacterium]